MGTENNNNNQTNETNQTNQVNETTKVIKKHHGPLYWVIVVAGVAFIVAASINIGEKLGKLASGETDSSTKTESNSNSNSNIESNSNVENNVSNNELTDTQKTDLSEKLALLVGSNYNGNKLIDNATINSYLFTTSLDETQKAYIITRITGSTLANLDKNNFKFNEEIEQSEIDSQDGQYRVINKGDYDTNYKKIFGTSPTSYPRTPACPSYVFDTNSQRYISIGACDVAINSGLAYIDDIKLEGNNAIVSVYVGSKFDNKIYNDYLRFNETDKTVDATTITEENKTQFAKYNFIFEKSTDGNYYYKSTQKAS